jgi:hypothetical protein
MRIRRSPLPLLMTMLAAGCSPGRAEQPGPSAVAAPRALAAAARTVIFEGTCDASGAVPIDARLFALADDENNVLRIYDADAGGSPLYSVDVSPELGLARKKKGHPEVDLEAATRIGDTALWLSSHARSKKGKQKAERMRFFSTAVPRPGQPIQLIGRPYAALLSDLIAEPGLSPFELRATAERPPQDPGGLNIEGMTATPDGQVLLGFRNPVPDDRALLITLRNPLDLFSGQASRFGRPVILDLGGLGVRSLSYWRGSYLIAAGHYGDGGAHRLFAWSGPGTTPREHTGTVLDDLNPEAFFTPEERDEFMLLSDDGALVIDGERCKDLDDPARKRFRGVWLRPSA